LFWARFLPDGRLRYTNFRRRDEGSVYAPGLDGEPVFDADGVRVERDDEWRVLLSWDVADLLLEPREFAVSTLTDRLASRRDDLVRRVIRVFDRRRGVLIRLAAGSRRSVRRQVTDVLLLEELTARLDVLTGGYFSAHIEGRTP
jgi:hypothetical protein